MRESAARSTAGSAASVIILTGAPASSWARASRLRSATVTALAAKTARAVATVMMVRTLRTAGRRASWYAASAGPTRPRRTCARPAASAARTTRWATTRPAASDSSVGVMSASGPASELVARPARPATASAATTMSTTGRRRLARAWATRRSSEEIGSLSTGCAASHTAPSATRAAASRATSTPSGNSKGTPAGSSRRRAASLMATARPRPSGSPSSTVRPSSPTTSHRAPSRLRPRRRARATSGRRCSTAAAATDSSTTAARRPSWAISSGTTSRTCSWPSRMPVSRVPMGLSTSMDPESARVAAIAAAAAGTSSRVMSPRLSGYCMVSRA